MARLEQEASCAKWQTTNIRFFITCSFRDPTLAWAEQIFGYTVLKRMPVINEVLVREAVSVFQFTFSESRLQ